LSFGTIRWKVVKPCSCSVAFVADGVIIASPAAAYCLPTASVAPEKLGPISPSTAGFWISDVAAAGALVGSPWSSALMRATLKPRLPVAFA
jgi:hypothetical protein